MDTARTAWRWWLGTTTVLIGTVAVLLGDGVFVGSKHVQQAALLVIATVVTLMAMRLGSAVRTTARASQREVERKIRRRRYTAVQLHYRDVMGIDS